jgi:hypothetical protein
MGRLARADDFATAKDRERPAGAVRIDHHPGDEAGAGLFGWSFMFPFWVPTLPG